MKTQIDLLVYNSSKLITLAGPPDFRIGKQMQDLAVIKNGAIAVKDGKVLETGKTSVLENKYIPLQKINAQNKLVMPGFVDCHTHLVFGGSREYELSMKLAGASYVEILKAGGGIHSTVETTRKMSLSELEQLSLERLDLLLKHGTTTVEIKTGYGLDYPTEKKMLEVIESLKQRHSADIVSTFLGAHTFPKNCDRKTYIDLLINQAIPDFKKLAEFCDIFSEDGAFDYEETKTILQAAKKHGYKLKIHSGQFNDIKATGLAAKLGSISADHLENVSEDQINMMRESGTAAVLMPGVPFFLMDTLYPNARKMIDNQNIVALATDFNPGSCPSYSMQMVIALACYQMKMTPEEAITASTINAAYAVDRAKTTGSLDTGKKADILIMDISEPAHIPYYFGTNLVNTVIKAGKVMTIV